MHYVTAVVYIFFKQILKDLWSRFQSDGCWLSSIALWYLALSCNVLLSKSLIVKSERGKPCSSISILIRLWNHEGPVGSTLTPRRPQAGEDHWKPPDLHLTAYQHGNVMTLRILVDAHTDPPLYEHKWIDREDRPLSTYLHFMECVFPRRLNWRQGITCLNHIPERIIPEMKVNICCSFLKKKKLLHSMKHFVICKSF